MKTPSRAELDKLSFDELIVLASELAEEDEEIKKVRRYFIDEFCQRVPAKAVAPGDLAEGEFMGASLDGRPILLAKVQGEIVALSNKCPHRGFPLHHNGKLDGYTITCAYHGGQFDIRTGACLRHPTETYPCERFQAHTAADGTIVCETFKEKA
ncbi:MAG: non-heme iron oxygenase ferredoxin subunit [Deltaproteobacteria bacterium]|nr:non-heme iron oxygenase ferredoxin subunit [Deltaproteobacteria bacterium]